MALTLKEPVVYAVHVHGSPAVGVRGLSLHGRVLHASPDDARAVEGEARASGEFDEVVVRAYQVAAPGGDVRPGPVTAEVDPHLGKPVLYLVQGLGDLRIDDYDNYWFETCGGAVYASEDDAIALQEEARTSGKYDEVIVLAYPVVETGGEGWLR